MKKKKGIFGSIVNYIWNKSMAGKKESLINSYDNDPEVKQSLNNFAKANQDLKDTIEKMQKEMGKTKI